MTEPGRVSFNPLARDNPLAGSYLCVFLYSTGEAALHVLVPPYLSDGLGYGPAVIGAVSAVFALTSLLLRLPVGAVYTLGRARRLLVVGGAVSAGAFALVPLFDSAVPFAVLMALDGVGWALATTTLLAVLVASRPSRLPLASAMGWYSGFTGLGHTAGGVTAGLLADNIGYAASFLSLATLPILATVVLLRVLPDDLPAARTAPARRERARSRVRRGLRRTVRGVVAMPAVVWSGLLIMVFINFSSGVLNAFHPVLALGAGLSLTQIGTLTSCRSLASSVSRLSSGPLFARSTGVRLTTPLMVLGASVLWLLPLVRSSFWLQVPLFLAAGLSRGLLRVTGSAQAFDGNEGDERGQGLVAALLNVGLDLGKVAGPPLAGVIAQVAGVPAMFQACAVVMLAMYVVLRLMARRGARAPAPVSG